MQVIQNNKNKFLFTKIIIIILVNHYSTKILKSENFLSTISIYSSRDN